MWVSGRCSSPSCDAWFTVRVLYKDATGLISRGAFPTFCSKKCARAAQRAAQWVRREPDKTAEKERQAADRTAQKARRAATRQAVAAAKRLCWACWAAPVANPKQAVCDSCFEKVERSCRGKYRHETLADAAAEAARLQERNGVPTDSYGCPVCGWWHVGALIQPALRKRNGFVASIFVQRANPAWLTRTRLAWFETLSGWKRPVRAPR
jgi:hypothetical protein